nr:GNAT family N-acetyltransferase [Kineococcus aurantiacus]
MSRPTPGDLDDVFALYSDPAVWEHLPSGRHTHPDTTARLLAHVEEGWQVIGLGSWVVRDTGGALVGTGGCDLRLGLAWNLGYRLARNSWGKGLAQEVIAAAVAAARRVRPDLAITAYLLEHNVRSRAAAERAGLDLVWRGPDAGNPDPTAVRLLFADRPLSAIVVRELTAT